jgi:uncharacterized protein (TIGR03437 family)
MKTLLLSCLLAGSGLAAVPNLAILAGASPAGVATDSQGNIYVAGSTQSTAFPATAGALQSQLLGGSDAFIAKFSADGTLLWSTYFGGSAYDYASGVAVDPAGNVLVAGTTQSADLPVLHAFQNSLRGNANAFLLKLNSAGQMLYSTYLGGSGYIQANAVAVDAVGSAYVTGSTSSADFPGQSPGTVGATFVAKLDAAGAFVYSFIYSRPIQGPRGIAVDASGSAYVVGQPYGTAAPDPNLRLAFVFKLSPDGSHLLYESFFGGSQTNYEAAIAVDSSGSAYIAGTTGSADFPLVHSLQPSLRARPLWKSSDGGNTWAPLDNLPFAYLQALAPDPTAPGTLFAGASDLGVFKTMDGGATWTRVSNGIGTPQIYALAVDPVNPTVLYAAGGNGAGNTPGDGWIYQSTDGGATWRLADSLSYAVTQLTLDPLLPPVVYALASDTAAKTADAGATWNAIALPVYIPFFGSIAVDPDTEGAVYAYSINSVSGGFPVFFSQSAAVFRSTDGAATWQQLNGVTPGPPGLVVDPSTNPATIYAGTSARSNDGGKTWTPLTAPFGKTAAAAMAADPLSGTLYAAATASTSLEVSTDRGQTWSATGWPYADSTITAITPTPAALYATVQNTQTSAFVVKLSPDGSTVLFSTLLGGHPSLAAVPTNVCGPSEPLECWEPSTFASQNYASGIALDPSGNIVVVGGTRSADFPTANAAQSANAGGADAFVSVISPDGQLQYSSYLGGSKNDGAAAVAVDSQGNVTVVGETSSPDFLGATVPQGQYATGFVVKAVAGRPSITAVLSAASFQPGIEAGSWVMIQGANLAGTTRTWNASDFVGNNLPLSLDGVRITIDGKPAFVEYISPTQINVQAPTDSATGTVYVVVTYNGAASAPATAQLQAVAPAFFMAPGTNYALASRLPDWALVGNPSSPPAKPGDMLVLWGTGFGATNPAAPAGTVVSGAPVTVITPTVTVGGVSVPVVSSVLTTGPAGLYQVTIQLPANVPTGTVAVQASVGGVPTQTGLTLLVGGAVTIVKDFPAAARSLERCPDALLDLRVGGPLLDSGQGQPHVEPVIIRKAIQFPDQRLHRGAVTDAPQASNQVIIKSRPVIQQFDKVRNA